jgi:hypothetical protein
MSNLPLLAPEFLSQGMKDVIRERQRQIAQLGWTPEHDDAHKDGELELAAACYALAKSKQGTSHIWPWAWKWWKPREVRENLVRAAALLLAAIERIDRKAAGPKWKTCAKCDNHHYCTNILCGCDREEIAR